MNTAFLLAVAATTMFFALAVAGTLAFESVSQRRRVHQALRAAGPSPTTEVAARDRDLAAPLVSRLLLPNLERLGQTAMRFAPTAVVDRLDEELTYAGSPAGWDGKRLLAMKLATAVGLGVGAVLLLPTAGFGVVRAVVLAPFAALLGYYLPEWVVRSRSSKRQKEIQRALPDSLDLMSITVEAGLGFDAALDRVSREMGGPLGEEIHRVVQEMRLGKGRGEALRDLGNRTTVPELKSFVLAMVQAEIFGISVARVLHSQAEQLRIKRRQRAEEQAQKLPVKIVFPLILCVFPFLMIVLLGPAAIQVYENIIVQ
jgi:tight adherence protein C